MCTYNSLGDTPYHINLLWVVIECDSSYVLLPFIYPSEEMPTILMTQQEHHISVRIYHLIIVGILAFLLGGFVFVAFLIYCRRVRSAPVIIANEHNGYPPAYAPSTYDDVKYDQSKVCPK